MVSIAITLASAQTLTPNIPFEKLTANSPTTAVAHPKFVDIPQFIVDPFWPKPLPNNRLIGQISGVHVDATDNIWIAQRPRETIKF